ncbi:MAG: type II toxin-antitoxin system VapC family toxin [Acetobacteraceae bacterium]
MLDSSATLAWTLPGDGSAATDALLEAVGRDGAAVPTQWSLETANVLLIAERRGRITAAERRQALDILMALPIQIHAQPILATFSSIVDLAAAHDLTVYDASYLDPAISTALPLATLDRALRQAAHRVGLALVMPSAADPS